MTPGSNLDSATVSGFGDEWARFNQAALPDAEATALFEKYFSIFPWSALPPHAVGADVGTGSGRWARFVAPRVKHLYCVDASSAALAVARQNLAGVGNIEFLQASVDRIPVAPASLDFAFSLGVLHHVPDTRAALASCARLLKPGAPFLVYLYYALENRPAWFRALWRVTDRVRRAVSRLPPTALQIVTDSAALGIYYPAAALARAVEKLGRDPSNIPLSSYRSSSLYTMRTDARDRFGTRLEQRFTRAEIADMMRSAGFEDCRFREEAPYWVCVGYRSG